MRTEPAIKRTIAFVDRQNLSHNARNAFGYNYPGYENCVIMQFAPVSSQGRLPGIKLAESRMAFLEPRMVTVFPSKAGA